MTVASKNWFEIDRAGLAKLIERRGKIALVHELIGNALDADGTTRVEVVLSPEQGVPHATVVVSDDSMPCRRATLVPSTTAGSTARSSVAASMR